MVVDYGRIVRFVAEPPIGTEVFWKGQAFRLISIAPHIRSDGMETRILTWETDCMDCGCVFHTTTTMCVKVNSRRCEHHRSGRKANRFGKRVPNAVIPN